MMISSDTIPDHVPLNLVTDIDIYPVPGGEVDPQAAWRAFKGKGPLVYCPRQGGYWIATCGADVFRFFRDTKHFSNASVAVPDPGGDRMLPIQADPPLHSEYRRNIIGLFTPAAVAKLEDPIRELTVALIEGVRKKGECEFIADFALQLPLSIFLTMMGLPLEDRLRLRRLIETFARAPDIDVKRGAHLELHRYLDGWIERRLVEPGDDAITLVTRATIGGRPYTHEEMLATTTLLMHAGLDTVTNMLGFFARHLAQNPLDRAYIRANPDRLHDITQELLRRYAVPNLGRVIADDFTYKGVELKKGDRILLAPSLFNMDEDVMPEPDKVDLGRHDARHITFGAGPHSCAGALLARKELTVFLQEWLTRIPEFSLDPARPPRTSTTQTNTVDELWLKWDV